MADRQFYDHDSGTALDENNEVFDVTKWRKDQTQTKNGQEHNRVYDASMFGLMTSVLNELKGIREELISIKEGE